MRNRVEMRFFARLISSPSFRQIQNAGRRRAFELIFECRVTAWNQRCRKSGELQREAITIETVESKTFLGRGLELSLQVTGVIPSLRSRAGASGGCFRDRLIHHRRPPFRVWAARRGLSRRVRPHRVAQAREGAMKLPSSLHPACTPWLWCDRAGATGETQSEAHSRANVERGYPKRRKAAPVTWRGTRNVERDAKTRCVDRWNPPPDYLAEHPTH
jgi:hypothetical protein